MAATPDDPFDLDRFVVAQDPVHARVTAELRRGRKDSHWMWFVFPQFAGLGLSAMSQRYAIRSLDEARAYLDHPVLGARLKECAGILVEIEARPATQIFGPVDAQKLRSSMTLFLEVVPEEPAFAAVLERYFGGELDDATLDLIRRKTAM